MSLIDLSSLTLNPEEATEAGQAIFEKIYMKPELSKIHGIQTGVKMKQQIPFFGRLAPYLLDDPGSCGVNSVSQDVEPTQKYWNPALISGRFTHCQGDLSDSLFKMWRAQAKANPDYWETIANEQLAFLLDRISDATYEDILLKSMFGDTAADNVSGGGNITNGLNANLLVPFDGIWKQILAGVTATTIYRSTISENALASKALQMVVATDTAITAMKDLHNNADSRIFADAPVYQMTRSLYNNYIDSLETKSLAFTLERAEDGTTNASYRGIPIIVREDWDRNVKTYFDQGTTYLNPHRIILSDINNIPVATLSEEDLDKVDSFYERKDKKHYFDLAMTLDAKVLEEYRVAVAY